MNNQINIQIYRDGHLDKVAMYKKQIVPVVTSFLSRVDARMTALRTTVDKTPIYASKALQALNKELDRQVGRV